MIIKKNPALTGNLETILSEKLKKAFDPEILTITDESSKHADHNPEALKGETHFRIKIVSKKFQGISRLERHRWVYEILDEEIKSKIHALALTTHDPEE